MQEIIKLIISIFVLGLGFPLGIFLAKITKEELNESQRWFKLLTWTSLGIGFLGLILRNDVLMFSCFFIAIVTSQSLRKESSL